MFRIITIPFDRGKKGFDEEDLNRFLLNKHVKGYRAEFFEDRDEKFWTVFLEYDPVFEETPNKDQEGLDEPQKMLLDRLKAWRKERAEKDGVPVYIIGTNKELMHIVKTAPTSLETLKTIKGFGRGKVAKYGSEIIDIVKGFYEKS